jgi:hypothetical protein
MSPQPLQKIRPIGFRRRGVRQSLSGRLGDGHIEFGKITK